MPPMRTAVCLLQQPPHTVLLRQSRRRRLHCQQQIRCAAARTVDQQQVLRCCLIRLVRAAFIKDDIDAAAQNRERLQLQRAACGAGHVAMNCP